ncbi:MAG TPA: efflux RND transporter periplasmic adaptor subunit [Verrucomicrobiota bacterium]|nr:efflux RND transporter periplasmic adaptor subunit [Verrucomicrobiota bacterium]
MIRATVRAPAGFRPAAALLVAVLAAALSACNKEAPPPPPPPVVGVLTLTPTNAPLHAEIIGQLDSPQNVEVRARVEAFVEEFLFTEGAPVKEGDLLFRLDRKPLEERLKAAEGALAEAQAALRKYEKDVARLTPLAKERAIPQQDLDNALASVDVGRAAVLTAQARVDAVGLDLSYTEIHAKVSGLIGAKQVSVGDLVGKGEPTLLATISVLDPIWFYCAISEVDYLRAEREARRKGRTVAELPVSLILADGSVHPAPGRFVFQDRAVDPRTGTLRMRAEFANAEGILRPGMFARIRVDLGTRADSLLVPERAIAELQGRAFVWVVDAENKASQRTIQRGETLPAGVLVPEGLQAGERIVVEGLQKVREGAAVTPRTLEELAREAAAQAAAAHPKG